MDGKASTSTPQKEFRVAGRIGSCRFLTFMKVSRLEVLGAPPRMVAELRQELDLSSQKVYFSSSFRRLANRAPARAIRSRDNERAALRYAVVI